MAKDLLTSLQQILRGEVKDDKETLDAHAHDTSLFKVDPELVVYPRDSKDIERLVQFVKENKKTNSNLNITPRAGGSDMTGGPLGESIILDVSKYLTYKKIDKENLYVDIEPGVFFRDFEKDALKAELEFPVYPASKGLCAFGGMIMNNCAGEKTLRYGQMRNFVESLDMVLSDGKEYTFKKLNKDELEAKKRQQDFEGELYRKTFDLIDSNYDLIEQAKPKVSKNSSGYALWDVYDREKGTFDLAQLFTGSQGTLGICTGAKIRLIREKKYHDMIALFFKSWDQLPDVVNVLLKFDPESLETFDAETLKLGIKFMPEIAHKAGTSFIPFALKFLPEAWIGVKMLGLPKLVILVEIAEESQKEVDVKREQILNVLKHFKLWHRVITEDGDEGKYWTMRRESFNLLRQHVKGKRTAPFIEDFCVTPEVIPEFLPRALKILADHGIDANIAGHAGNGNFHIIPLMNLRSETERRKISVVAEKFYDLVIEYGGTITAEHNDGIIRTPFVEKMFGSQVYGLFKEVKHIFDPQNIFNPGKKVDGSIEYLKEHIVKE